MITSSLGVFFQKNIYLLGLTLLVALININIAVSVPMPLMAASSHLLIEDLGKSLFSPISTPTQSSSYNNINTISFLWLHLDDTCNDITIQFWLNNSCSPYFQNNHNYASDPNSKQQPHSKNY